MTGKLEARWQRRRLVGRRAGVCIAVAVAVAGPAAAQIRLSEVLRASDSNGDGKLQRSEAPIHLLARFKHFDRDGDGAIDSYEAWEFEMEQRLRAEDSARRQAPPDARPAPVRREPPKSLVEAVRRGDANGDGRLTADEMPAVERGILPTLDQDGDGALDLEEARRLDAERLRSGPPSGRTMARTVQLMDTNGDGLLQRKEAPLAVQRVFERFDRDGDGAIDREEALAADERALSSEGAR